MGHIENIIQALIESLAQAKPVTIKYRKVRNWNECTVENEILSPNFTEIKTRLLNFRSKSTQRNFTIVSHLLSEIYKMLARNTFCTKRELYYRDVEFLKSQTAVNKSIEVICTMLNVHTWELGVLSTSKGLIAGEIVITTEEDEVIECTTTQAVPQNPSTIKSIESSAEYVLVVEKDTVFTRLIEGNFFEKSLQKCILVTAKGYPDVNTRVLLKKIVSELDIPVYMIADADPYGVEIMCTYKYGSLELVSNAEQLALSKNMEWIGYVMLLLLYVHFID
jgi:meiotic recombination protein SPO11